MGVTPIEILESGFSKNSSSSHELSILIGVDSLSYLASDAQNQVQLLKQIPLRSNRTPAEYKASIQSIVLADAEIQHAYASTSVAFDSDLFVIVPDRLFDENELSTYLAQLTKLSADVEAMHVPLVSQSAQLVFGADRRIINAIKQSFPMAKLSHLAAGLINHNYQYAVHREGQQLFINVQRDSFQTTLYDKANLIFYNQFSFQSAQDFIYYILLIFDQFQLKPETLPVTLSGSILKDSVIYKLLYKYIRNIQFMNWPDRLTIGSKLNAYPAHQFLDLFSIKLR